MNDMFKLSGKTFVVLGGAGLIGSAFSRAVTAAGGQLVIADLKNGKGENLAKEIGGTFVESNIAQPASIEALAELVIKTFGRVDGVVNATYPRTSDYPKSFEDADNNHILENIDLHLGGTLSMIRAFAPKMQKKRSGAIVLLGSIYGVVAPRLDIYEGTDMVNTPGYAAAKSATIALAKYFASLYGVDNIRVNAISPGGVFDNQQKEFVDAYSKHARLQPGMLAPDDLAGALVFLFSDASKKITGQNLIVDAGWTI
jgi:NAD(P)-dependent dehydrogenase (short-subunit alcohol dehydrogenase family)